MEYNTEECGWDGGDCVVEGYPDCHVDDPSEIGNGECETFEDLYNTKECGWDGGDCVLDYQYPDCQGNELYGIFGFDPEDIGDSLICHYGLNTKECGWDGGDCLYEGYPDCHVLIDNSDGYVWKLELNEWIGNGICNEILNSKECGWDGGDCAPPSDFVEQDSPANPAAQDLSSAEVSTAPTLAHPTTEDQTPNNEEETSLLGQGTFPSTPLQQDQSSNGNDQNSEAQTDSVPSQTSEQNLRGQDSESSQAAVYLKLCVSFIAILTFFILVIVIDNSIPSKS
jgi:hypothetical protein